MNWITILGIIISLVGTLLTYYGTTLSNDATTQSLKNEIRSKDNSIEELVSGKDELLKLNKDLAKDLTLYQKDLTNKEAEILALKDEIENLQEFELNQGEINQINHILDGLDVSSLPEFFAVKFSGQSPDGARFTDQIANTLKRAGYPKIEMPLNLDIKSTTEDGDEWSGIVIQVKDIKNPPRFAVILHNFFIRNNIKVLLNSGQYSSDHDSIAIYANKPYRE